MYHRRFQGKKSLIKEVKIAVFIKNSPSYCLPVTIKHVPELFIMFNMCKMTALWRIKNFTIGFKQHYIHMRYVVWEDYIWAKI